MSKTIYHYHPETGEYLSTRLAEKNPMAPGKYLLPAHATFDRPSKTKEKKIAVWDGSKWAIKPDHRGEEYWLETDEKITITKIGEKKPDGALNKEPEQLVTIDDIKSFAKSLLRKTDWLVLREMEGGKPAPAGVKAHRQEIRSASDLIEKEVGGLTADQMMMHSAWPKNKFAGMLM